MSSRHVRRHVVDVARAVRRGQHGVGGAGHHGAVVGPVVAAGVVEAHAHAPGPHRLAQVAHQVAPRPVRALDGVHHGRGPQGEAVVVLGGEHHVARAGGAAQVGQGVEVGARRGVVEGAHEIVVGVVLAVHLRVVQGGGTALDLHGVAVPLGVRVLAQHPARSVLDEQLLNVGHPWRPPRHRVEAPVDEDPELGVVVPDRDLVRPQRLPRPLKHVASPRPPAWQVSPGPEPLPRPRHHRRLRHRHRRHRPHRPPPSRRACRSGPGRRSRRTAPPE